jgi:hypothetical protein
MLSDLQKIIKAHHLIALVGIVVLAYAIYQYSGRKNTVSSGFGGNQRRGVPTAGGSAAASLTGAAGGVAQPANPAGQNEEYAKVSGLTTTTYGLPPAGAGGAGMTDPADLLPKDVNSQWANLNPAGGADFKQVSFLKAGYHYGINTVGSSLRNANLQERSEPANPTTVVSPWQNTTIEPDLMRVPMEIGCGGQ